MTEDSVTFRRIKWLVLVVVFVDPVISRFNCDSLKVSGDEDWLSSG